MKNLLPHISVVVLCMLMVGCTDDDAMVNGQWPTVNGQGSMANDPVGQPVMFSAGNENLAMTRAATPYMPQNGRFVCSMYYHPAAGATDESDFDIRTNGEGGTFTTAWLRVNNRVGNSVYRKNDFEEPSAENTDEFGFDKSSTLFYWQNRLTHAFLALADYNQLSSNLGATSSEDTQGLLKMFPYGDAGVDTVNVYDLTRGTDASPRNKISDQPDPIMALTIQKPEGSTQEANRVRLYFKHQFSQIQVNLKGADDESATLSSSQIEKVELLGVSTEGYVVNRLNKNGTVGDVPQDSEAGTMIAASAKEVDLEDFTDEQLSNNKWGTSFEMFDMAKGTDADGDGNDDGYAVGYLKSYNAIAFGELWGIRVTWKERTGEIRHKSTYEVPLTNENTSSETPADPSEAKPVVYLRHLQSGMKYIYDLELRRGTLAIIRTQIENWRQHTDLVYGADGIITN